MEQINGRDLAKGTTSNPISIVAVLTALFEINLVIKLQHYCVQFHWLLFNAGCRDETCGGNHEELPQIEMMRKCRGARRRWLMERLGIFGSAYYGSSEGDRISKEGRSIGTDEIARLFEEEEVSLDEIKEAFYMLEGAVTG